MKKIIILLLLVITLSACTLNQSNSDLNGAIGEVNVHGFTVDDIIKLEKDYALSYKFDYMKSKLYEVKTYDDNYIYSRVKVYAYIDNEWKDNGSAHYDPDYPLNYLFLNTDVNFKDFEHTNKVNFLSLDKNQTITLDFNTLVDNFNFKVSQSSYTQSYLDSKAKLYKDRELILYLAIGSNDTKEYEEIESKYFDEFLNNDTLTYDSGIVVTLTLSDKIIDE